MKKKKQQDLVASAKKSQATGELRSKSLSPFYTGINSMMNWLAILLLVISFIYSMTPLDTAVAPRYIFLSGFTLLFVLYFFAWRKRIVTATPLLVKLIFASGGAFALWNLLGLFTAVNYHEGYYEIGRHLLHLLLIFCIMQAVMQETPRIHNLFYVLAIVALLHSLIGVLQFYNIAFTSLPGNYKPYSLMTNRNLFGSAQALLLPFAIYTFYAGKRSWRTIASIAICGIFVSLVLSQTRSAWLSGIAIISVAALLVLIFIPALRKKWMLATVGAIVVIALIVAVLILPDKESALARSVTERAASITTNSATRSDAETNISERLKMWRKTVRMTTDNPLLGVGVGNWKVVIPSYGVDSTVFAKGYFAPDRVHNVYLQTVSETGIPGAIFYFGMWLLIAFAGIALIRKTTNDNKKIITILMLAGLSAVALDAMFSFANERIEHSLYMMLMAGIIMGLYAQETSGTSKMTAPKNILPIAVIVVAAFNLFLAKKKFDFENHLKMAIYYSEQKRFAETVAETNKGSNEFFTIDVTGNPLEMHSGIAYKEMKNYDVAKKEFQKAIAYSPYNPRVYNNLGTVYWDLKDYHSGIEMYKKALLYAPEFETVLKNLAITYYQAGQYKECIETISKMKERDEMVINVLNDAKKKLRQAQ